MSKAFSPGNISCIFMICYNSEPALMHSLGVGFTTDKGVVVDTTESRKTEIVFNNKTIDFQTLISALRMLTEKPVRVVIDSELPLGCGFGLSGACTLATVLAVNNLFLLGKSEEEMAMIAHIAEVRNSTGLGDIAGQFNGGFLMKTKSGNPLAVERLNVKEKAVYYKVFGALHTKSILKDKVLVRKINLAGDYALEKIKQIKTPTLSEIIRISREFAEKSELLKSPEVINQIREIEESGGNASMIMLGNAVYSDVEFVGCERIEVSKRRACLIE